MILSTCYLLYSISCATYCVRMPCKIYILKLLFGYMPNVKYKEKIVRYIWGYYSSKYEIISIEIDLYSHYLTKKNGI
jgi:hypothetical protein